MAEAMAPVLLEKPVTEAPEARLAALVRVITIFSAFDALGLRVITSGDNCNGCAIINWVLVALVRVDALVVDNVSPFPVALCETLLKVAKPETPVVDCTDPRVPVDVRSMDETKPRSLLLLTSVASTVTAGVIVDPVQVAEAGC